MAPFLTVEERDKLIVDRTVVYICRIHIEPTQYGPKWYIEIAVPPGDVHRVCSFGTKDERHPRNGVFEHLRKYLEKYPTQEIATVLVGVGGGYMLQDPAKVQ